MRIKLYLCLQFIVIIILTGCQSEVTQTNSETVDIIKVEELRVQNNTLQEQLNELETQFSILQEEIKNNLNYESLDAKESKSQDNNTLYSEVNINEINEKLTEHENQIDELYYIALKSYYDTLDDEDVYSIIKYSPNTEVLDSSPDGNFEGYWSTDGDNMGDVFIWPKGHNRPLDLDLKGSGIILMWSPDSNYVVVRSGTYTWSKGKIVSVEDNKIILDNIFFHVKVHWANDSSYLAFIGANETIKSNIKNYDHIQSVCIYNVIKEELLVVDPGTEDYVCEDLKIDGNNNVIYTREYVDGSKESLTYTIDISQ
ncbi:hypothetical protein [Vallitalea okinawensis]|uniref:hypothetical protein n=1 Tax=Vallitalea okinawensis TaxID=2078660 RepID=UPI000CFBD359|nr:hypothetical protein [Vallitalea okinawensis]